MPLAKYGDYEVEATEADMFGSIIRLETDGCHNQYSVYERLPPDADGDRLARWLADFDQRADAELFAEAKEELRASCVFHAWPR